MKQKMVSSVLIGSLAFAPILAGCESLPGNGKEQGAVIGGVGGAAAGAAVAKDNRAVGALVGGLLGAGGGYLIGQQADKKDKTEAQKASDKAQQAPATPAQARQAATADLNKDGFVTLDEVVAMRDAGLDDQEMIKRLRSTGQVFDLTASQEDYLINHGVNRTVVDRLRTLNQTPGAQPAATAGPDIGDQQISGPHR
jgi:hypothetical protein